MRRIASIVVLTLLLIGMSTFTSSIQSVLAEDSLLLEMDVSKTIINIGEKINITLTVRNIGNTTVTRTYYHTPAPVFDAYYFTPSGFISCLDGSYGIPVITEFTLEPGENYTRTLHWNLYQYQHIIGEFYPPVPGTYDLYGMCDLTHDSILDFVSNPVFVTITLVGNWWNLADVNFDYKVDIYDAVLAVDAYGSIPSNPNWNPHCDIAEPFEIIDIYDIVMICTSYGEEYNH